MHEKLSHLSSLQIEDLMRRYYEENEKVNSLIHAFNIDITSSNLVKSFPPVFHSDAPCPYGCSDFMVTKRVSRSSYAFSKSPYCPICNHKYSDHCSCENCNAKAAAKKKKAQIEEEETNIRKREIIAEQFSVDSAPEFPAEISVKDALYLLSLSRHSISEDFGTINPFATTNPPLAPTYDFQNQMVKHLYAKGHAAISEDSNLEAFIFSDDLTEFEQYYPARVTWAFLPGHNVSDKRQFLRKVEAMVETGDWVQHPDADLAQLWHLIAKNECIENYIHQLRIRDFGLDKIGPKTHETFEFLLKKFSVGQIFNLTWQSVSHMNDFISRKGIPHYQGKNMFVGAIQRKGEKAIAEGWNVKSSRRDYNCPQTVVSSTFFDLFLGIGQKYMEELPPKLTV